MSMAENLSAGAGRLTRMSSPLSPAHFDDLHEFVQVQVAAGYLSVAGIVEQAVETFSDLVVDPTSARAAATAVADRAVAAHREAQASWPAGHRLRPARRRIHRARRRRCACPPALPLLRHLRHADILEELQQADKAGRPARGYTFFHVQETEHGGRPRAALLSYGRRDRQRGAVAIGHEVVTP